MSLSSSHQTDASKTAIDSSSSSSSLLPSPFTTTSDVLKQLNAALASLDGPNNDPTNTAAACTGDDETERPRFELQKRFDNGCSRRATESELQAADADAKLKQTAQHVSTLQSARERLDFCEAQLEYGNLLFRNQQYREAIDVYLTCLLVPEVQQAKKNSNSDPKQQEQEQEQEQEQQHHHHAELLARILNNLAQSALQLQWYQKCIRFCNIAIEQLQLEEDDNSNKHEDLLLKKNEDDAAMLAYGEEEEDDAEDQHNNNDKADGQGGESSSTALPSSSPLHEIKVASSTNRMSDAMRDYAAKFYFKRAKAHRLKGLYLEARRDLQQAGRWLDCSSSYDLVDKTTTSQELGVNTVTATATHATNKNAQIRVLQKEQRLLVQAVDQGRHNQQRQAQAMKQLLSSSNSNYNNSSSDAIRKSVATTAAASTTTTAKTIEDSSSSNTKPTPVAVLAPLYETAPSKKKRQYSTLRAPSDVRQRRRDQQRVEDDDYADDDAEQQPPRLACCKRVVARVARLLLFVLGDYGDAADDDDDGDKEDNCDEKVELKLD